MQTMHFVTLAAVVIGQGIFAKPVPTGFQLHQQRSCTNFEVEPRASVFGTSALDTCIKLCAQIVTCYGVNYRTSDGTCHVIDDGCILSADIKADFYSKLAFLNSVPAWQPGPDEYKRKRFHRCIGADIGEQQVGDLPTCLLHCQSRRNCSTVSWQPDTQLCLMSTSDCQLDSFQAADVYTKSDGDGPKVTNQTVPTAKYQVMPNRVCSGGSSTLIGNLQTEVTRCVSLCNARSDCLGFTYYPTRKSCIARTSRCHMERDETEAGTLFYRKYSENPDLPEITGFDLNEQTTCVGGSQVGTSRLGISYCAWNCFFDDTCGGFAFYNDKNRCIMMSVECVMTAGETQTFFYSKHSKDHAGATMDDPNGYEYFALNDTWCYQNGSNEALEECNKRCSMEPDCLGYNFKVSTEQCYLALIGCKPHRKAGYVFYQKIRAFVTKTTSENTTTISPTTVTVPAPELDGFELEPDSICTNSDNVSSDQRQQGLMACANDCLNGANCFGFQYNLTGNECWVLEVSQCDNITNSTDDTALYRKSLVSEKPLTSTETSPSTISSTKIPTKVPTTTAGTTRRPTLAPPSSTTVTTTRVTPTKLKPNMTTMATSITGSRVEPSTSTIANGATSSISPPEWSVSPGTICNSQGAKTFRNVTVCISKCQKQLDCVGFNYWLLQGTCKLAMKDCTPKPSRNVNFHRIPRSKGDKSDMSTKTTSTQSLNRSMLTRPIGV